MKEYTYIITTRDHNSITVSVPGVNRIMAEMQLFDMYPEINSLELKRIEA